MTKYDKKGSFILHDLHYQTIKNLGLSREEKGDLFDAIFQYHVNGEIEVELSTMAFAAFQFIKTQIDVDTARYQEVCERRRKNGAKGGAPKGNTNAKKADGEEDATSKEGGENADEVLETENNQNKQMVVLVEKQPKTTKTTYNENENENDYDVSNETNIRDIREEINSSLSFAAPNDALAEAEGQITIKPKKKVCDIDFMKLMDYYNSKVPAGGMPQAIKLTNNRKAAILAREKEYGKEAVQRVIDLATASSFLNGNNKTGFRGTFDWIFLPRNFIKILEGNYNNSPSRQPERFIQPTPSPYEAPRTAEERLGSAASLVNQLLSQQ